MLLAGAADARHVGPVISTRSVEISSAASAASSSPARCRRRHSRRTRPTGRGARCTSAGSMSSASAGRVGRAEREQVAWCGVQEHLERGCVESPAASDGVGDRVVGRELQRAGDVTELEVEVDDHDAAPAPLRQADREVGGQRRLAAPPLGHSTVSTRVGRPRPRCDRRVPAGGGSTEPSASSNAARSSGSGASGAMTSRVAGPQRRAE